VPEVFVVDGDLEASVETAGGITVTKHPTLTRMAAGAILPGSALIPGLAFQKTETHDYRELYFVIEHPEWAAMAQVNPGSGATVRAIALALNQLARSIAARDRRSGNISQPENPVAVDRTVVLEQLGNSVSSLGRAFFPKKSFGRRRRRSWAALRRWRQATARRVSTGACR
jgi:hypothetical protein